MAPFTEHPITFEELWNHADVLALWPRYRSRIEATAVEGEITQSQAASLKNIGAALCSRGATGNMGTHKGGLTRGCTGRPVGS